MGKTLNTILATLGVDALVGYVAMDNFIKVFDISYKIAQEPGVAEYSGKIGQAAVQVGVPLAVGLVGAAAIGFITIAGVKTAAREYTSNSLPKQSNDTTSARDTKIFNSHERLAYKLFKKGQYERAIESYDRMIELDPNYRWAYFDKIAALEKMGRLDETNKVIQTLPKFRKRKISRST